MNVKLLAAAVLAAALSLTGCVTSETKPIPKVAAKQAAVHIPEAELLDVGIRVFDPGIPENIKDDEEALAKKRIYPDLRKAEARYIPTLLRETLEGTAQWGAVRVIPDHGRIRRRHRHRQDGRIQRRLPRRSTSRSPMPPAACGSRTSATRAWSISARTRPPPRSRRAIPSRTSTPRSPTTWWWRATSSPRSTARTSARWRACASPQDLAPDAMAGMTAKDKNGVTQVVRLPADGDPTLTRIEKIRERDTAVVDTVNDYYASFHDSMEDSYGSWRQTSFTELEKEMRARSAARTRTVLGAAALIASIFAPNSCSSYDSCRIADAARNAGTMGGIAAILSGMKKYADARTHADALKELTQSFQSEVAPQVVEVEGHTLRLTGTAEDQYREWRKLLKQLYEEETGAAAAPPPAEAPATAPRRPPRRATSSLPRAETQN